MAARLNLTEGGVKMAVLRMRRRFGELLRAEIAHTVTKPEEIDEEIRCLFAAVQRQFMKRKGSNGFARLAIQRGAVLASILGDGSEGRGRMSSERAD